MNDPEDSWHAGRTSVTLWFYLQWLLPPLTGAAALTAARTTTPSRQSFKPLALAGIPDSLCGQSRRPHHPWRSAFPACRCTMNTPWPSLPAPPAVSRPPASKQQSKRDPNDPLPSDGTTSQSSTPGPTGTPRQGSDHHRLRWAITRELGRASLPTAGEQASGTGNDFCRPMLPGHG